MGTAVVLCCDCDEYHNIEDTRKIAIDGLQMNLYICNECLEDLPKINEKVLQPKAN